MTISFKISRTGTRYQPKLVSPSTNTTTFSLGAGEEERINAATRKESDLNTFATQKPLLTGDTSKNKCVVAENEIHDDQITFTFNLFDNGYSIGKSLETLLAGQTSISTSKSLRHYTGAAEYLFSAMECGRIPVDIVDDLPCKYVEGEIFYEVRDYRSRNSEGQLNVASGNGSPLINRACLRMSHALVVKDMQAMVSDHWTYRDFLEVESRILEHMWPRLFLDPKQERVFESTVPAKLNLGLCNMLPKEPSDTPDVAESSNYTSKGKQICSDRVSDSSSFGQSGSLLQQCASEDVDLQIDVESIMSLPRNSSFDGSLVVPPPVSHLSTYHVGTGSSRVMEGKRSASPDAVSIPCQRDNRVGLSSPTKEKARLMHTGADGNQWHLGHQLENLHEPDLQMKRALMKQQVNARGMQYVCNDMQSFYPQTFVGDLNPETSALPFTVGQQGAECNSLNLGKLQRLDQREHGRIHMVGSEITINNSQTLLLQQYTSQKITGSSSPQNLCNNIDQPHGDKARKQNSSMKRKSIQARASAGCLQKSPLSSRSGELSGSVGPQFGAVVTSGLMSPQQKKSAIISISSAGVSIKPSFADSAAQHLNHAQAAAIHKSSSFPLAAAVSGVGSPAAFDNRSLLKNANGPLAGTQPLGDPAVIDSFSKIKIATSRYQPNHKRFKGDVYFIRNPNAYSGEKLVGHLSSNSKNENTEGIFCEMPLSKSLEGGNMNVCKIRSLDFSQIDGTVEGNDDQFIPKDKLRMFTSEKPYDGAVAMHLGEIEEADYLAVEDYLPTLPNTMEHKGYHVEDHLQPRPVLVNHSSITQFNPSIIPQVDAKAGIQQFPEGVSGQPSNDIAKYSISDIATVNSSGSVPVSRMLPRGGAHMSQASERLLPGFSVISRTQKAEMPSLQQNLLTGQQIPQFQRPSPYASISLHHVNDVARTANIQVGAHMASNSSSLQPQLFEQQHQQQEQLFQSRQMPSPPQKQKDSISSLSTSVGMGFISANPFRFRGLGSGTGIEDGSGVTGTGFSAPMLPISSKGNTNLSPMNLSSASNISSDLHSGTLTPDQAAFMRLETAQTRSNTSGGLPRALPTYSGSAGLPVPVPAHNQMQHADTGVMPGMHLNFNVYQQKILQNLMRLKQQQRAMLQQETTPTLQALMPPQHMGVSHQMNPFQQQLPQQGTQMNSLRSSGAVHHNMGDLPAAQLCSLMEHEGYHVEDHLQPRPVHVNHSSITQLNSSIIPQVDAIAEIQQFPEGVSGQPSNDIAKYSISDIATLNSSESVPVPRMLPRGDAQLSQASQRLLPGFSVISRAQKAGTPSLQHNLLMRQQIPQFQRPYPYASNSMHHVNDVARTANIQVGAHMASNSSSLQPQLFQQQHQQQQQLFQSRQMPSPPQKRNNSMSSLSTSAGMGYTSVNLGSGTGIRNGTRVTGTGFSAPMSPISSIENTNLSPMNLSSVSNISRDLHSGTLTPDQAALMRLEIAQTRSNTLGGTPRALPTYPGSSGLPVPVPALNQMQHADTRVMPRMHLNFNEHQQKILQNLMRLKQQQRAILQQETTPTLQALTPPQHMGVSHQMNPFQQQLPQQGTQMNSLRSSGAVHHVGATNPQSFSSSSVGGTANFSDESTRWQ